MLVDVGVSSLKVYENDFEKAFLEASSAFYAAEGREYVVNSSVPAYLSHVETRLREESARVLHYLDISTKPKVHIFWFCIFIQIVLESSLLSLIVNSCRSI